MLHSGAAAIKWQKANEVRRMHLVSLGLVPVNLLPKAKSHFLIRSTCETFCTLSRRYRFGSGKSCSQLTVEELSSFVRQLYNLPCSLPQAPMLKVGKYVLGFYRNCVVFSLATVKPTSHLVNQIRSLLHPKYKSSFFRLFKREYD